MLAVSELSHLLFLRSFPVADVTLNITQLPDEIDRDSKDCMLSDGPTTWYILVYMSV